MIKDFKSMTKKELIEYLELREKLPKVNEASQVADYLMKKYGKKQQEYFLVILLDGALQPIKTEVVTIGIVNKTLVHPREVFAPAIINRATSIIIAHNHPSGDLTPSDDDINTTDNLIKASKILGIKLLDHIIFSDKEYFSMFENNTMLFD